MKNELPYADSYRAAPTIDDLVRYLRQSDNGSYVYRGQVREYSGPLIPSVYRAFIATKPVYDPSSPEYRFCLRRIGRRFVGNNYMKAHQDFLDAEISFRDNEEISIVRELQNDLEFARRIVDQGFEQALETSVPTQYLHRYRKRSEIWRRRIDNYHRLVLRNDALLGAFGYLVGQTLAQQFGLSSEALDATTDIDVAAFFATHQTPSYAFVDSDVARSHRLDVGVIYRFARIPCDFSSHPIDHYNYYRAPGTVVMADILRRFELVGCSLEDSLRSFKEYHDILIGAAEVSDGRPFHRLRMPTGTIERSRIGRQCAALIIPDELRVEKTPEPEPSQFGFGTLTINPRGQGVPIFAALEDARYREFCSAFYFRHSDQRPDRELTASHLWPNSSDLLLVIVLYLIRGGFEVCDEPPYVAPPRLDLVDPGYGVIDMPIITASIGEYTAGFDSVSAILGCTSDLHPLERHLYTVRQAAKLCYEGYATASAHKLNVGLTLCHQAQEFDNDSVALALLEHIIFIGLGERGEGYAGSWARAIGYAQGTPSPTEGPDLFKTQRFVGDAFMNLFYRKNHPCFPGYFYEFYQTS